MALRQPMESHRGREHFIIEVSVSLRTKRRKFMLTRINPLQPWHRWVMILISFPRWIISVKTAKHYQLLFRQPRCDESGCRITSRFREAGNLLMIKGRSLQNVRERRLPACLQKCPSLRSDRPCSAFSSHGYINMWKRLVSPQLTQSRQTASLCEHRLCWQRRVAGKLYHLEMRSSYTNCNPILLTSWFDLRHSANITSIPQKCCSVQTAM